MFSKRQIKILKLLKNKQLTFDELSNLLDVDIDYLYEIMGGEFDKYIKETYSPKGKITLSEKGIAVLSELREDKVRFWIPVIISLFALLFSIIGWFLPFL